MTNQWPALVVTSGPQAGQFFGILAEQVVLGRGAEADIRLADPDVSRAHLHISRRGPDLVVHDTGSTNGTWLNGVRLADTGVLRPGDTLRVADVDLQYVLPGTPLPGGSAPASQSYALGDVHGPVNTGNPVNRGGSQIVGSGSIYHGNVHHGNVYEGDRVEIETDQDPFQELFSGRGVGRLLMAIGLVATIAGFAIWMSVIFSGMGSISAGPDFSSPFDKQILGLNAAVTGFTLFAGGGLLMSIGAGMSKAARKREDRRKP